MVTPIGIPVSGPEKDMRADGFHYYAIIIYTPITFTNNLKQALAISHNYYN